MYGVIFGFNRSFIVLGLFVDFVFYLDLRVSGRGKVY